MFTAPRSEKRVAKYFAVREIENFLPTYRVVRKWKNRTTPQIELPLFPNYIFVRIERRQRVRVLEVQGVLTIVGSGPVLSPIPDLCIEALRAGVASGIAEPYPYLTIGKRVRIRSGPMAGIEGLLAEARGGYRFVLTLELIHQSVAVEVDAENLETVH